MKNEKTIYNLELHEMVEFENGIIVLRVAGGWLYSVKSGQDTVFIPYNSEFNESRGLMV